MGACRKLKIGDVIYFCDGKQHIVYGFSSSVGITYYITTPNSYMDYGCVFTTDLFFDDESKRWVMHVG